MTLLEKTRHVKNVEFHPSYENLASKSSIFDFALVEVQTQMYPYHKTMKPVCLPIQNMWKSSFVHDIAMVTSYGRFESKKTDGKDQTTCQTMEEFFRIIEPKDPRCSKVSKCISI